MDAINRIFMICLSLLVLTIAGIANADEARIGEQEFKAHCAVCHGANGKGDSAFTGLLKVAIPDLTQLSKKHNGVFPISRVYELIDGRAEIKAHGSRYMPIWGSRYSAELTEAIDPFLPERKKAIEKIVNTRVIELVFFIASIQE